MSITPATGKQRLRATRDRAGQLSHLGDDYLAMVDVTNRSTVARVRADREQHQATRPCPVCDRPMVRGKCREHGTPAEDRGDWLWAR
jgi:hypothetical protein